MRPIGFPRRASLETNQTTNPTQMCQQGEIKMCFVHFWTSNTLSNSSTNPLTKQNEVRQRSSFSCHLVYTWNLSHHGKSCFPEIHWQTMYLIPYMRQGAFHLAVHTICQIAEDPKWHKEFPAKRISHFFPYILHHHHVTRGISSMVFTVESVASPAFDKRWTPCRTAKSPWRAACWVGRWEATNLGHINAGLH